MQLLSKIHGDKVIWAIVILLALISFLPVYSASTNLVYVIGKGSTFGYLAKHSVHLFIGFIALFWIHKMPFHYFRALSLVGIPVVLILLTYTLFQGTTIGGANASRWIQIPFIGIGFQTSTLAFMVLIVYVARYLAKVNGKDYSFKDSLLELWLPVFAVLILILPANFSTTALIFSMVCMLVFIGMYPFRYLATIIGIGILGLTFFILVAKAFPDIMPNRVDTWISRVENFTNNSDDVSKGDYQIEKAKIAIASGKIYGLGPGKSVQKNFLPQSSSDFIFAIIVEEYGLVGALGIIGLYLLLLIRFIINAQKAPNLFGKLVIIGLGFSIIFQAFINMGVAVELLPVTGQTLPLISSGGTSIWMTCVSIGIILSVTKKKEEIEKDNAEAQKREEALQRIIDKEVALEESNEENKTNITPNTTKQTTSETTSK